MATAPEPNINSPEDLTGWLSDKPTEWAHAIATRAALRVFPLVLRVADREGGENLILQTFRANFISWAAHKYPAHDMTAFAIDAAFAATRAADAIDAADDAAINAIDAAFAANRAAVASTAVSGAATRAADAAFAAADARREIWKAVEYDCQWLANEGGDADTVALFDQSLWLPIDTGFPTLAHMPPGSYRDLLAEWQNRANSQPGSWAVIFSWYVKASGQRTRDKTLFNGKVVTEIATQPDAFWTASEERSAGQIVDEIAEIVLRGRASTAEHPEQDDETVTEQRPAPFQFQWRNNRIGAIPPAADAIDNDFAADLLEEVREKATELAQRLGRANASPRVTASVGKLLGALPSDLSGIRPGVLRSRSRSIEADAAAFSRNEEELFPDAVAGMVDLSDTLRDLLGCFPVVRDIEAEVLALDLAGADLDAVKSGLDDVLDIIGEADDLADESAIAALHTMEEISSEAASGSVREKRTAEYALVVRNVASVVLREARRYAGDAAGSVRKGSLAGLEKGTEAAVKAGLAYLAANLAGPVVGLGMFIASFAPLGRAAKTIAENQSDTAGPEAIEEEDSADEAP
ncbi:hypothetical protein [Oricola indica]|jgi:hypothetical protein|uniref:hypothetical protein n=1 Tax=Oricola indica TaxID=2872591 RepID=UPI001CBC1571|nr:hypothetical protein [Oricola indica]